MVKFTGILVLIFNRLLPPCSSSNPPQAGPTTVTHVDERPPRRCCRLSKCCDPCCLKLCGALDGVGLNKLRQLVDKINCCKKKKEEKMEEVRRPCWRLVLY